MPVPQPCLEGVRILELCDASGWLAGRMLADLGAEVVVVEPIDRTSSPDTWTAFGAGKRSIEVSDLAKVIAAADVVLETGVTDRFERLATARTIWCAITPFGRTGPKSSWRASDLTVQAQSGVMWMTGEPGRAPVACSAPTSWYHGCADAVAGVLMALLQRERTERGQLVDVSLQEAHLMATMSRVAQAPLGAGRGRRAGALMRVGKTVQREIWPCADGFVTFGLRGGPARIPGLKRMVAWIDSEGMATPALTERDWDSYNHNDLSQDEVDAISLPIAAFLATKTMTELYDAALARGLMLAPANTAREILNSKQSEARGLFAGGALPASFVAIDGLDRRAPSAAPEPGAHTREVLDAWLRSTG